MLYVLCPLDSMKRFLKTLVLALLLVAGAWALYHRDEIHSVSDALSLARQHFIEEAGIESSLEEEAPLTQPSSSQLSSTPVAEDQPALPRAAIPFRQVSINSASSAPAAIEGETIRVASFKIHGKGKLNDRKRIQNLSEIIRQFDVVAIQDDDQLDMTSQIVNYLNQNNLGNYRFVDRRDRNRTFAIVFDQDSIALDHSHWYSVNDPDRLLTHEPLVAWFRARNAPADEAFTFTLANLELDAEKAEQELGHLADLFLAIREDGRSEDDVLIAGNFKCGDEVLVETKGSDLLNWVVAGRATNTESTAQMDNIIFNRQATVEYTGKSGVYDFMSRLNTTLASALTISKSMPVWGEFSVREGESSGRISSTSDSPYRIE